MRLALQKGIAGRYEDFATTQGIGLVEKMMKSSLNEALSRDLWRAFHLCSLKNLEFVFQTQGEKFSNHRQSRRVAWSYSEPC